MKFTRQEIREKLDEVITLAMGEDVVDVTEFDDGATLADDLGLSSVGVLYTVIAIEEFFGIEFDDVSFGDFKTVGNVIDYIESKIEN